MGIVSGALWGVFAVLTKGVVHRLDVTSLAGVLELARTPEVYAWVIVAVLGTSTQQAAFRAGALTASLPTMTVVEPMVGCILGVVVLGRRSIRGDRLGHPGRLGDRDGGGHRGPGPRRGEQPRPDDRVISW